MPGQSEHRRGEAPRPRALPAPHAVRVPGPCVRLAARAGVLAALWLALSLLTSAHAAEPETIKIRAPEPEAATQDASGAALNLEARRGFDYEAFTSRLEALWFQRKAFLAAGRDADAATQSERIRAFCAEEGVRNLEGPAGALLIEAKRHLDEGNHARALASLEFAEFFSPGSSEVRFARAKVYWASSHGVLASAGEALAAVRASLLEQWRDLALLNHLAVALLLSLLVCSTLFGALMALRYQGPLRHEVEERVRRLAGSGWASVAGWATLLLPLLAWVGAGWATLYWTVVTFRFMRRGERAVALLLLAAVAAAVPMFRVTVALRGMTEDPIVRNALASAGGAYEPERIVKLKQLVESHPEEPTYRFLLAGMYRSGRYFEEAYEQYKQVLAAESRAYQAHVNIGNVFFQLGQHGDALQHYRKAIDMRPDRVLAYYNAYVAQSESFRFKEAQEYLDKGSMADPDGMSRLLYRTGRDGGRPVVVDATVDLGSLWRAALEGRRITGLGGAGTRGEPGWGLRLREFVNPLSVVALAAMLLCPLSSLWLGSTEPARSCIRCGLPFCPQCKSEHERGREYCNQCLHLFVLGEGLAAETKTRKLYQVERHARRARLGRRVGSLLVPGAGQLLRGRAGRGCLLALAWLAALTVGQPFVLALLGRLSGLELRLDLLRPAPLPAAFAVDGVAIVGLTAAALVWIAANTWRLNAREA